MAELLVPASVEPFLLRLLTGDSPRPVAVPGSPEIDPPPGGQHCGGAHRTISDADNDAAKGRLSRG